ncbi:helix-turn-helix domain-containing protein [Rhodococcus aetherivorans]|uniref:helix-turn-helix domain-containing protein n=1 Tax=Rhodococcus aetherivorans TaxID=191292 RepID=UPI00163B1C85|nr:helix-turn-helix transcriptional regulator [Rhodococcus aetherivorans]
MLDAAAQLFLDRGYAGTTVASVAAQSGVSPETIYKSFGGKTGSVRALHARSLAGRGRICTRRWSCAEAGAPSSTAPSSPTLSVRPCSRRNLILRARSRTRRSLPAEVLWPQPAGVAPRHAILEGWHERGCR